MGCRVTDNARSFGPVQGRFDVKDRSVAAALLFTVGRFVFNDADSVVRNVSPLLVSNRIWRTVLQQWQTVEMNANAKINVNLPHRVAEISETWRTAQPQIVVIDDLLTAEALQKLRLFCLDSTIWLSGLALMVVIGLVVGALPAVRGMRLRIVDALSGR